MPLFFAFAIILFPTAFAQRNSLEDVHVIVKVHSISEIKKATGYPFVLENPKHKEDIIKKLSPGDELLLKGRIENHPVVKDNKTELNPTFHITEIHPISLSKLGKIDQFVPAEKNTIFRNDVYNGSTKSIPVTGEVASALTMTASILMLKDLTEANSGGPKQRDQLSSGVLFSAGVMATGLLIWKQLQKKGSTSK